MKTISFLATSLICLNSFAQEKPAEDPADMYHSWQLGINVSPDYNFRTLKNNDGSAQSNEIMEIDNEIQRPKLGYTAGFALSYNFNQRLGIEMGLQFSDKGFQTKDFDNLTFGSMIDPRRGFSYSNQGAVSVRYVYNDYYLDVPVKANLSFGKRKIRFITSAGIAANIFLKETITSVAKYEDGSHSRDRNNSTYDYSKLNISPMLSAGIDWKLGDRSNLRIEPTFRYGVIKIIDAPVTAYLWNAGLNVSYYLGF
jgi:hypothetical protein